MAMPMERLALTSSAFHVTTTNLKKVSHTLIIRHPNLVTRDHLWPFKNVNLLSVWGKESGLVCQAVKQRLPFLLHHQPTLPLLRRISVYSFFFVRSWHWSRCRHPLRLEKTQSFANCPGFLHATSKSYQAPSFWTIVGQTSRYILLLSRQPSSVLRERIKPWEISSSRSLPPFKIQGDFQYWTATFFLHPCP